MNNKKGAMEMSALKILGVAVFVLIFIFTIVLIKSIFDKPEFKITQEECFFGEAVEIKFNINNYYASQVLELTEYNLHALINGNENITCDEHICAVTFMKSPRICEQVEVDELKIDKSFLESIEWRENEQFEDYPFKEYCDEVKGEYFDLGEWLRCDFIILNKKNMLKEDLTIEWLDEKAVCYECYYKEDNTLDIDGDCEVGWDECFQYKIKEYTIEVK